MGMLKVIGDFLRADTFTGELKAGTTSTDKPDRWFMEWALGDETASGMTVTPQSALRLSAVWACVRVRSEDIGKCPTILYRRTANGRERAETHPLYDLIKNKPNPRQTAFEFFSLMQAWVDLKGNACALIERDKRMNVTALWPIEPSLVEVVPVDSGRDVFFRVTKQGGFTMVPSEDMLHLKGPSTDGYCGMSPISYYRETIGMSMAALQYGAAFFGNSSQPNGYLKFPKVVSQEAAKKLRADWESKYKGVENAHKLVILDGGLDWQKTSVDNTDAQYIENRQFQNQEIYRLYRMPPHKVGDLSKATFSNIEQQFIEYVQDCLLSEMVRWEQTLNNALLLEADRKLMCFEFLPDMLLRGDFKSRMDGYKVAMQMGLTANEWRAKENLNSIDGGDVSFRDQTLIPITDPGPNANAAQDVVDPADTSAEAASEGEPILPTTPKPKKARAKKEKAK